MGQWLLACFVLFCTGLKVAESSHYQSKVRGVSSARNVPNTERRLGQDKADKNDNNKDKNNKGAAPNPIPSTPRATRNPTRRPTPNPTRNPTRRPTPNPTRSPTSPPTSPPTVGPSLAPTPPPEPALSTYGGSFVLQFSLTRDPPFKAADVLAGRESELEMDVVRAMLFVLCTDTDFIVGDLTNPTRNQACLSLRNLVGNISNRTIISEEVALQVSDRKVGMLEWTEWSSEFSILQVGDLYHNAAVQRLGNPSDVEVREAAVEIVGETARDSLFSYIRDETFNDLIGNQVKTSLVGQELEVLGDNSVPSGSQGEETVTEELDPSAFHALRVVGILLFFLNIILMIFVSRLSARRRKRINDQKCKYNPHHTGGLNTDEEVDMMLYVGRRKSEQLQNSMTSEDAHLSYESSGTPPYSPTATNMYPASQLSSDHSVWSYNSADLGSERFSNLSLISAQNSQQGIATDDAQPDILQRPQPADKPEFV